MGYVYSGSHTTIPIGRVADYNNTNPSRAVAIYRTLATPQFVSSEQRSGQVDFSTLIYGNSGYSLLHPNSTTETVAQKVDIIV